MRKYKIVFGGGAGNKRYDEDTGNADPAASEDNCRGACERENICENRDDCGNCDNRNHLDNRNRRDDDGVCSNCRNQNDVNDGTCGGQCYGNRDNRRFWIIWLCVTAGCLLVVVLSLCLLQSRVRQYESTHADAAAADIFADLVGTANSVDAGEKQTEMLYRLLQLDTVVPSNEIDAAVSYVASYLSVNPCSYRRVDGRDGAVRYTLFAADTAVLSFSLAFEEARERWTLSGAELLLQGPRSIRIRVPLGMIPVVNGKVLSDFDVIELITPTLEPFLPAGLDVSALRFCVYVCEGLFAVPQVLVQDEYGNQYAAVPCANNSDFYYYDTFPAAVPLSDGGAAVMQAVQTLDLYFAGDLTDREVLPYVIENNSSPILQRIRNDDGTENMDGTLTTPVPSHNDVQFTNAATGSAYWFDEYTYFCRIKMTQILLDDTTGMQHMISTDRVAVMIDPGDGRWRVYALFDSAVLFATE